MIQVNKGNITVIFVSRRTDRDPEGYARAAAEMEQAVATAPGYLGHDSLSVAEGRGITISYWQDRESAAAWRAHARHTAIRAEGRKHWYDWYRLVVAEVDRAYDWQP
jgi:heme-degrading monooxygenase HmoA